MKILKYKYILSAALLSTMLGVTSCVNDLDTVPLDKDELVSDVVFGKEIGAYEQSLAKIYAGLVIGGNAGGDSDQDVVGIDGGSQASFIRVLWNMQELASDIAHCCWNDPGIPDFNHISWAASSPESQSTPFKKFSSFIFHAKATEGNNPQRLSLLKREEPSLRKVNVTK